MVNCIDAVGVFVAQFRSKFNVSATWFWGTDGQSSQGALLRNRAGLVRLRAPQRPAGDVQQLFGFVCLLAGSPFSLLPAEEVRDSAKKMFVIQWEPSCVNSFSGTSLVKQSSICVGVCIHLLLVSVYVHV